MSLKLTYQYQIILSLANRGENIEKISEEIERSVKEFNIRSRVSKNVKQIVKYEIKEQENLLYIWLNSNIEMNSPMRGLSLFSKLIIEQLDDDKDREKRELLNNIIRNRCFFRLAEEPKKTKNLKLEKSEEIEEVEETHIDLSELRKLKLEIIGLLTKSNISYEELEEIKEILKKEMV